LKGLRIRPTSDRVREAIFNIIGHDLKGVRILDLFPGTGSLGIEALSRGGEEALFIDRSPQALNLVEKNLGLCRCHPRGVIIKRDLRRGLPLSDRRMKEPFGLVFIDPPYGKGLIPPLLKEISESGVLSPPWTVVAESSASEIFPPSVGGLRLFAARVYGTTKINIYRNEDNP
jgi:16S rRNA (guanine966-N2)-methyltransferase